jgi:outer membrane protein
MPLKLSMKNIKLLLFFLLPATVWAQETLSLSAAIETALKNNFSVNIATNEQQIAVNENTLGNAGFLPRVDLAAGYSKALNNTKQQYSDGRAVSRDNASVESLTAGGQLGLTLFDGMRMFFTRSRLTASEEASTAALKLQIETTVSDIILAYFNAVKIRQQINVIEETITIYDERIKIADTRFTIGSASKLDLLQAKVDRNARQSELLKQRVLYEEALASLNQLMGKQEFSNYLLQDSITISYVPPESDFINSVLNNNRELRFRKASLDVEKYLVKEFQSLKYPVLDFNLNYNYSRTENEVGLLLLNKIQGPSAGFTFSWNLFNGFNTNRGIKNARLNYNTADLLLSETRSTIVHDTHVALKKFQSDLEILKLEETNWNFARENSDVALEAYRLGTIAGVQLKEAQNSYQEAFSRLVEARYQAKVSETRLMQLNGDLVK